MEAKYLADGRKVVVIGPLNAEQTIVQEVFVSGDREFPSGKNFVVDSLHDEPVVSWKEKEAERVESHLNAVKRECASEQNRLNAARERAKAHAKALGEFSTRAVSEQLEMLEKFVSGCITHLFIDSPYKPEIRKFDDHTVYSDSMSFGRVEGLKLLTLFGDTDGNLSWRLHRYPDGSGGQDVRVIPAESYEKALSLAQSVFDDMAEDYLSGGRGFFPLEEWRRISGLVIPSVVKDRYNAARREGLENQIAEKEQELAKVRAELEQLPPPPPIQAEAKERE